MTIGSEATVTAATSAATPPGPEAEPQTAIIGSAITAELAAIYEAEPDWLDDALARYGQPSLAEIMIDGRALWLDDSPPN